MKCPLDGSVLKITERSGVEIDYCPQCRGVWLDRGELDKIIEISAGANVANAMGEPVSRWKKHKDSYRDDDGRDYDDYKRDKSKYYKKRKRSKSILSELFDFD